MTSTNTLLRVRGWGLPGAGQMPDHIDVLALVDTETGAYAVDLADREVLDDDLLGEWYANGKYLELERMLRPETAPPVDHPPAFKCPTCGTTSYSPRDIEEGYCFVCRTWPNRDPALRQALLEPSQVPA